jgi:hypothetical protein
LVEPALAQQLAPFGEPRLERGLVGATVDRHQQEVLERPFEGR